MAGIAAIFLSIGVALLGLIAVRRRVPLHALKAQHEVASVSFGVIGGFYAVLLAFVLVASWQRFERARENTDSEANALADLYRQAGGLPEPTRSAIRTKLLAYAHSVVETEWQTMREGSLSPLTQQLYVGVWTAVLEMTPDDAKQAALFQCMVEKLNAFGEARRYRLLYMENGLPPVIWAFLLIFGAITVGFTYFFGMPNLLPQAVITAALVGTITFTLFIIFETQTPFSGLVAVPDRAFRIALSLVE